MKSQIYNMNDSDSSTHFNNNPRFETSSLINKDSSFESSFSLPSRIKHPPNVNIEPALENDHQEINTKSQIDAVYEGIRSLLWQGWMRLLYLSKD